MRSEPLILLLACVACGHTQEPEPETAAAQPRATTPAPQPTARMPSLKPPAQPAPKDTTEAVARLRATAAKMSSSHFDAHFVITGEALRELAPALETLPCDHHADGSIADLRRATEEYEQSDALRHIAPARDAMRVFERLYVSRTVPGRSVGTGLGLAIVGELAAAMGGSAAVERATGGATFVVRIPVSD